METPLNPASRPGDLWSLGDHRLICGDATDAATVARVLAGHRPNLMVTDPPYGVNYDPAWRERMLGKAGRAQGLIRNDDRCDWRAAWSLFPGDVAYVWHSTLHTAVVEASLRTAGFLPRSQIIWDKGRLIISRGHYHWRHEPCWYAVRRGRTANWQGDRRQMTVWQVPHRRSATGHPTEKPVEIMRRPILNHTRPGDFVYDPFLGSGSTLLAAEETGRACLGLELTPEHCDRIVLRWTASTGGTARREAA
ncbi:DNA-methyltransferase [Methylobacterium iners]|uniref:Methyltransferase n=1 Tax=Methylobacterium iners TaxID=418707 RepID=A0ABQ4RRG1_9HYPH|nr:site-specific DNA-methyltransferase [Methylobacterium iners]GJD93371.1 DNA adenine methyltransferase YhdJ [Methylobacterium iners]